MDIGYIKAAAWDKVIAFMNETLTSVAKEGFDLHESENIYLDYLSEYETFKESQFMLSNVFMQRRVCQLNCYLSGINFCIFLFR